jgi:two-component system, NarL family, nitrate/nitrite response regulator NarL
MLIDVLVASDLRLVREWLTRDLRTGPDVNVAGAAAKCADVMNLARRLVPGLLIVDRGMPDSLTAVREIIAQFPRTRVLAFGVHETEPEVAVCADAGIHGFVPRDASSAELLECVRRTMTGEFVGSSNVAALLLRHVARRTAPLAGSGLTARELEIVRLLELGRSNKEIAAAVGIEVATVKNHVHRLLKKLQASCRSEAAAKWRRNGDLGTSGWVARSAG